MSTTKMSEFLGANLQKKKCYEVALITYHDPHNIYVMLKNSVKVFLELEARLKNLIQPTQGYRPRVGEVVACKCSSQSSDGLWHRVMVVEKKEQEVDVFYLDVGLRESVSYERIGKIEGDLVAELAKVPFQAVNITVVDLPMTPILTQYQVTCIHEVLSDVQLLKVVEMIDGKPVVCLYDGENFRVNQELCDIVHGENFATDEDTKIESVLQLDEPRKNVEEKSSEKRPHVCPLRKKRSVRAKVDLKEYRKIEASDESSNLPSEPFAFLDDEPIEILYETFDRYDELIEIQVINVVRLSEVYVKVRDERKDALLERLHATIAEQSDTSEYVPQVGEVVSCSTEDGWRRVKVTKIYENTLDGFLVDVGVARDCIPKYSLRKYPPSCTSGSLRTDALPFVSFGMQAVPLTVFDDADDSLIESTKSTLLAFVKTAVLGKMVDDSFHLFNAEHVDITAIIAEFECSKLLPAFFDNKGEKYVPTKKNFALTLAKEVIPLAIDAESLKIPVELASFGGFHDVYVRKCHMAPALSWLQEALAVVDTSDSYVPFVGELVACWCAKKSQWCRAAVTLADAGGNLTIFSVDYGISVSGIGKEKIRQMPAEFLSLPSQAIRISLSSEDLPKEIEKVVLDLLRTVKYAVRTDFSTIRLYNGDNQDIHIEIGKKMLEARSLGKKVLPAAIPPRSEVNIIKSCDVPLVKVPWREKTEVQACYCLLSTVPANAYFVMLANEARLDDMSRQCSLLESELPHIARIDEVVVVKFGNGWYRAIVRKVYDDGSVDVFYPDFGNSESRLQHVRKLPPKLSKLPFQGIKVSLPNKDVPSANVQKRVAELLELVDILVCVRTGEYAMYTKKGNYVDEQIEQALRGKGIAKKIPAPKYHVPVILASAMQAEHMSEENVRYSVSVSHLSDEGELFVVKNRQKEELSRMELDMSATAADPPYLPVTGEVIVAFEDNHSVGRRAVVAAMTGVVGVQVNMVDVGRRINNFDLKNARKLPRRFINFPMQAVKIITWPDFDGRKMPMLKTLLQKLEAVTRQPKLLYKYQLYDEEGHKLNEKIERLINTPFDLCDPICQYLRAQKVPQQMLEMACGRIKVRAEFCAIKGKVYLMKAEDNECLRSERIGQQVYRNDPHREAHVGELVLCCDNGEWWRAEVLAKDGDKFDLFFVDYARAKFRISVNNLRKIPDEFGKFPLRATELQVCGNASIKLTRSEETLLKAHLRNVKFAQGLSQGKVLIFSDELRRPPLNAAINKYLKKK